MNLCPVTGFVSKLACLRALFHLACQNDVIINTVHYADRGNHS